MNKILVVDNEDLQLNPATENFLFGDSERIRQIISRHETILKFTVKNKGISIRNADIPKTKR